MLCFLLHVALPPPQPKFTSLLDDVTVREGKPAQFQCHVSPRDADVTWFLHGEEIQDGDERYVIEVEEDARRLVILVTSRADHGDVTASLGGVGHLRSDWIYVGVVRANSVGSCAHEI